MNTDQTLLKPPRKGISPYLLLLFLVIYAVSRIPFFSQFFYEWDNVQHGLAMEKFDFLMHHPHPTGFLFGILGARFIDFFAHDANLSLVISAFLYGGLTLIIVLDLGHRMAGQKAAILAGAFLLCSPVFLFNTITATAYTSYGSILALLAWLNYRAVTEKQPGFYLFAGLIYGLAGGIHSVTMTQGVLIMLIGFWAFRKTYQVWIKAGILAFIGIACWLPANIAIAGGWKEYQYFMDELSHKSTDFSFFLGAPLMNHLRMIVRVCIAAILGLSFPVLILGWRFKEFFNLFKHFRSTLSKPEYLLCFAWFLPGIGFYFLLYFLKPGQVLTFVPGLLLFTAVFLVKALEARKKELSNKKLIFIVLLFCLPSLSYFYFTPRLGPTADYITALDFEDRAPGDKYLVLRHRLTQISLQEVRFRDTEVLHFKKAIEKHKTKNSILIMDNKTWDWRKAMWLFPKMRIYRLNGISAKFHLRWSYTSRPYLRGKLLEGFLYSFLPKKGRKRRILWLLHPGNKLENKDGEKVNVLNILKQQCPELKEYPVFGPWKIYVLDIAENDERLIRLPGHYINWGMP